MFTQRCFIRKNTPELMVELDKIGRDFVQNGYGEWQVHIEKNEYLFCGYEPFAGDFLYYYIGRVCKPTEGIDCGENEELFLAIASLRDDSDNMQWFTDGNGYWQQCVGSFKFPSLAKKKLHKATVSELINHFKK